MTPAPVDLADRLSMALPDQLTKGRRQFLCWRFEPDPGGKKPRKVPYYTNGRRRSGTQGSPEDLAQLATFGQALRAIEAGEYSGLGIAMVPGAGLVGLDFDGCVGAGGKVNPEVAHLVAGTYAEISPSGRGVRAFFAGDYSDRKDLNGGVEVFCSKGFLTLTGSRLNGNAVAAFPDAVRDHLDRVFGPQRAKSTRTERLARAAEADPVLARLTELGVVRKDFGDGRIGITCPFEAEHTTGSGDADCVYFLPHTGGFARGGFKCLHAHCSERPQEDFLRAIGATPGRPEDDEATREAAEERAAIMEEAGVSDKADALMPMAQFAALEIETRPPLLTPWLKPGSITLVSGWRGVGKSWFALGVLDGLSSGEGFGPWKAERPARCLFLDGEMSVPDNQERIRNLDLDGERKVPPLIYCDAYAASLGVTRANLVDQECRDRFKKLLLDHGVELFIVDNLASLTPGLDENSRQDWDPLNQWFLSLRFAGISTLMLHHVNKDGGQRGTSAREDNLDTSIVLKAPPDYQPEDGARFIAHFTKSRVSNRYLDQLADLEICLDPAECDGQRWTFRDVKTGNTVAVLRLLDEGVKQIDVAEALGLSRGQVCKIRQKAIREGFLTEKGKLTQSGVVHVSAG